MKKKILFTHFQITNQGTLYALSHFGKIWFRYEKCKVGEATSFETPKEYCWGKVDHPEVEIESKPLPTPEPSGGESLRKK